MTGQHCGSHTLTHTEANIHGHTSSRLHTAAAAVVNKHKRPFALIHHGWHGMQNKNISDHHTVWCKRIIGLRQTITTPCLSIRPMMAIEMRDRARASERTRPGFSMAIQTTLLGLLHFEQSNFGVVCLCVCLCDIMVCDMCSKSHDVLHGNWASTHTLAHRHTHQLDTDLTPLCIGMYTCPST